MRFSLESVCPDFCAEILPILEKHYLEIAHYQDIELNPDFEKYIKMHELGIVRAFTARDEDDKLFGYAIFLVNHNLHYSGSLQAAQDVIYLEKSKRGAGFGKEFINWCDSQLRKEGVQVVYHHVKQAHNFGPLLESLGYNCVDLIYGRRLDRAVS